MRALPTVAERRWVSGCNGHYEFVLGAGAKAKSVTTCPANAGHNLPILSVLWARPCCFICLVTSKLFRYTNLFFLIFLVVYLVVAFLLALTRWVNFIICFFCFASSFKSLGLGQACATFKCACKIIN
jgi:hypothetical protein